IQSLTCPRVFVRPASYVPSECDKIHGILKSVCDYHNLPLAQTWAVSPSTSFVSHDKNIKKSCSSFGTKCIGKVCIDVTELNQAEYPPVCGNKVKSCFAVSLHSVEGDDDYVLEFFLPVGTNDGEFVQDVVKTLKQKIGATSEFVLGDASSMDLSDISDSEASVTDVSETTGSANDADTESSTNVCMEKRRAAIFTDDGETSSYFKQRRQKG
nr:hypothetical protein [Tanacetum cinerariifolium]